MHSSGASGIDEERARELILAARAHWFEEPAAAAGACQEGARA